MNKLKLLAFLLLSAFLIQSCKKDTVVGTAYTTAAFQANINGSAWAPDTISTAITYNSAAKTKVFTCTSTKEQKQIIWSIKLNNADNSAGFTIGAYNVDSAATVTIQYNTQQKDVSGNYVFLPHGTVSPGAGKIIISSIDPVKKQITGTFDFYSRTSTVDSLGNVSITIDNILGGEFTSIPYTFTSN
jgi:hypothetical protein